MCVCVCVFVCGVCGWVSVRVCRMTQRRSQENSACTVILGASDSQ